MRNNINESPAHAQYFEGAILIQRSACIYDTCVSQTTVDACLIDVYVYVEWIEVNILKKMSNLRRNASYQVSLIMSLTTCANFKKRACMHVPIGIRVSTSLG